MDFDKSVLQDFVIESIEYLESIEDDLLTLEKQKGKVEVDLINRVFRAMHTIKGGAGFLGLNKINTLSHKMETLLSLLRDGVREANEQVVDILLEGIDLIRSMLLDVENSNDVTIDEIVIILEALIEEKLPEDHDEKELTASAAFKDAPEAVSFKLEGYSVSMVDKYDTIYVLQFDLISLAEKKESPLVLLKKLQDIGYVLDGIIINEQGDLSKPITKSQVFYYMLYACNASKKEVAQQAEISQKCILKAKLEAQDIEQVSKEPEKEIEERNIATETAAMEEVEEQIKDTDADVSQKAGNKKDSDKKEKQTAKTENVTKPKPDPSKQSQKMSSLRINVELLDQLMNLAGELVLVRNQQLQMVDRNDTVLRSITKKLDVITSELQETIMQTRMQSVGNIFNKFPRLVRDLARKLNKEIELTISGNDVELDKAILESLSDPLTHIIRNSCDHGIELPDVRKSTGKDSTGKITLDAYHEAGQISIKITDDGKGVDPEDIKEKALEKGLKNERELTNMSKKEILALLMLPGFSTAEKLSDVSGRGVGMDVVKSSIEKIGGSIDFDSEPGKGTVLILRLPLTLAIIPSLIVSTGQNRFAIPQINLEELVTLYDEEIAERIEYAGNWEIFRLRDKLLPLVRLSEVLESPEPFDEEKRSNIAEQHRAELAQKNDVEKTLAFAVVHIGELRFGLIIDRVIGTEEIVVKPMHSALKSLRCYAGATIMGDGQVALILDIEGVSQHTGVYSFDSDSDEAKQLLDKTEAKETTSALLFSAGGEEQLAIDLSILRKIEEVELDQIELVGDKEFVSKDDISYRVLSLHNYMKISQTEKKDRMYLMIAKSDQHNYGILIPEIRNVVEIPNDLDTDTYQDVCLKGTTVLDGKITLFIDTEKLITIAEPDWFKNEEGRV